jgi:hypothetical protein
MMMAWIWAGLLRPLYLGMIMEFNYLAYWCGLELDPSLLDIVV